jgi:galactose mutarotase-like enzyme
MSAVTSRLITISDGESRALVYPERGYQLFGFSTNVGGRSVDVIHTPPGDIEPADRRYGNPILFPAVGVSNGSRNDAWDHNGVALPMPPHGWARNVYWQVTEVTPKSVTAVCLPHPGFKLGFPFDFELRLRYQLAGGTLVVETTLSNTGKDAFPYALGFHPYLCAPLGPGGRRDQCEVAVPAGTRLSSGDAWRTIARAPEAARVIPATSAELPGSVVLDETGAEALELVDRASGLAARVSVAGSAESHPVWVVWSAAPDAPYVCLEPWTDAPNALNRAKTRTISAGATHQYRMVMSARTLV